ncbi:ABC transporter substrate-binding protein [Propioniciclava sinopodophylli]|uniref:ABC transporter substrate-binding protein n=1 Tax=Propioniciclava sinopodophylli TaxID=1837344 RepID=UPI0024920275|nr:ABC transporter substrate-binding protein [Propioniciclava sinopodophylli]
MALAVAGAVVLGGCAAIPADPDGTLDRVRTQGVLRAGASPGADRIEVAGADVSGPEAAVVQDFAASLGAHVAWSVGGEEELVAAMERGELDLIAGGLTDASPWSDRVALTRPYITSASPDGERKHVLAVPLGENALLFALESWLDGRAP